MSVFSSSATAATTTAPSTSAILGGIGEGLGAVAKGVGAFSSAKIDKANLANQALASELNAKIADIAARSAIYAGQRQEQAVRSRGRQLKATQKTAFAANGIDLASQTVVDVLTATDEITDIDADTVRANTAREAWGYRTQGLNYSGDAAQKRIASDAVSPLGAASTSLLTDASRVSRRWYEYGEKS